MAGDAEESDDERATELSTLAAIYPELVLDPTDPYSASIDIPVEPIEPLAILFPAVGKGGAPAAPPTPPSSDEVLHSSIVYNSITENGQPDAGNQDDIAPLAQDTHLLSHLPPLKLQVTLPNGYPTQNPPCFHLQSSTPWLPEKVLQELRGAGHSMWEDMGRDQVVYSYMDYLRDAADSGFGLNKQGSQFLEVSSDMKLALLDFDLKSKRAKFEAETFECGVCIEPKKGSKCHKLQLCGHVFCVECLQDFFNSCITEGNIGSIKCMAPQCDDHPSKHDPTLDPSELLEIPLSHAQVQRYIKLKRKQRYESDPTTIYCPRSWCQGPARVNDSNNDATKRKVLNLKDRDTIPNNAADRLAICLDCSFAFCIICKASWHGEYIYCIPRACAELTAEELASERYMTMHSTPCPTCLLRCQKEAGCNHMICRRCNTHFCYLCSAWLCVDNPYEHYNNLKSPCNKRLWELEGGDGE